MNINKVINDIIHLPKKFYTLGDISVYSLLKKTDYFEIPTRIDENDIYEALIKQPECIDKWMDWSNNKRTNSGWYFNESNGKYIVEYFSNEKNDAKRVEYSDIKKACAAFIKKEIEDIRTNSV